MFRSVLVLTFVCVLTSTALAKNLCIQLNNGPLAGSHVVLKKVKLGARNVAPLQGYLAIYSAALNVYFNFHPIYGGSIVNSTGNGAFAMSVNDVRVIPGGSGNGSADTYPINLTCAPGTDGKINVLDPCSGRALNQPVTGHVIDCAPESEVP